MTTAAIRHCSVLNCDEEYNAKGMCKKHYQRVLRANLPPSICTHKKVKVSKGLCWDCHITHLRKHGQGDRADRLVVIKHQKDEGSFDFVLLVKVWASEFANNAQESETQVSGLFVSKLRTGRPWLHN